MHKNIITANSFNSVLSLNIIGRIWQDEVAPQVKMYVDQALASGDTSAIVYINSEGGSVFEAQEIVNELKRMSDVTLRVGSLAASAATYIMCHFPAECYATSQFMIHKPMASLSGNEDQMQAEIVAIKNLTNTYRAAYSKKMGKTEDEVEALWKNDYWMNAQEAKDLGLIQSVISEKIEADAETIAMMVACGCPTIPTTKQKIENMSLVAIAAAVSLGAQSTEAEIVTKVTALKTEKETAVTERDAWKQKFEALQKDEAEGLVNEAISLGLIPEALKATTVASFSAEAFDAQKTAFTKLITDKKTENQKAGRHTAVATAVNGKVTGALATDTEDTYDYLQKHNPAELRRIATEDPEKYTALAAEFGKGVRYTKA